MSCQADELSSLPLLFGCPGDDEWFLVGNAEGGVGVGKYARRQWVDLKRCVFNTISPYVGVVDRGNATDPVSGTGIFTSTLLAGLGTTNNGDIQIVLGEVLRSNFGDNASFAYTDNGDGTGTITLNTPETFFPGSTLFVDRNQ